ncbi:MAG: cytochrome P450 [Brevundimonas sp.]
MTANAVPASIDLKDPAVQQCPYPHYARLRQEAPVSFMENLGVYYVASYELGRKILIDSKRFGKGTQGGDGRRYIEPHPAAKALLAEKDFGLPMSMMSNRDGVEHRKGRSILDSYFQAGTVRQMADYVTETAEDLLDRLEGKDEVEVVADFAIPLPVYVIADLMGIPRSEYKTFKRWSDGVVTYLAMSVPEKESIEGAEAMLEMHQYMVAEVHKRRKEPRGDLLTTLAQGLYDGRLLTDHEICGFTDEILVAGNETTTSTIAFGLLEIARNPKLQAMLRATPDMIPQFVEETLRVSSPLQVTLRRTLVDVNVGGIDIPAGSKIYIGLGSANHDECAFADPDNVHPEREPDKIHVTFGAGVHHCLGAELARLELRTAFALWLKRFSHIELAQPADSIVYPASYAIRGPTAVRLKVTPA